MTFREAVETLAERCGLRLPPSSPHSDKNEKARKAVQDVLEWAAEYFQQRLLDPEEGKQARDYLHDRNIEPVTQKGFRLGVASDEWDALMRSASARGIGPEALQAAGLARKTNDGRYIDAFRNRLIFPIEDLRGSVIGFGARRLDEDDQPKYLNSADSATFKKGRVLYGLRQASRSLREDRPVIVVEGYMDVLALHQHGFSAAVACLGSALTDDHAKVLRRYTSEAISVFDPDVAGAAAADRAIEVFLRRGLDVKVLSLPEGLDPADFLDRRGSKDFQTKLNGAIDALEFKWRQVSADLHQGVSGSKRRESIERFFGAVAEAAGSGSLDEIDQSLLLNRVAAILAMSPEEAARAFERHRATTNGRSNWSRSGEADVVPPVEQALRQEDQAQIVLVEVLLNEPALFDRVRDVFYPSEFADSDLRTIAMQIRDLAETLDEFRFESDLLPMLEEERAAAMALELFDRGARRSNFLETVDDVGRRLRFKQNRDRAREEKESFVRNALTEENVADEELLALTARFRGLHAEN
jgi:DNA primase